MTSATECMVSEIVNELFPVVSVDRFRQISASDDLTERLVIAELSSVV